MSRENMLGMTVASIFSPELRFGRIVGITKGLPLIFYVRPFANNTERWPTGSIVPMYAIVPWRGP